MSFSQDLPPEQWRRLINEYGVILPDPALRLKFTRKVLKHFSDLPGRSRFSAFRTDRALRKVLEEEMENVLPESRIRIREAVENGIISTPSPALLNAGRMLPPLFLFGVGAVVLGAWVGLAYFRDSFGRNESDNPVNLALYSDVPAIPEPDREDKPVLSESLNSLQPIKSPIPAAGDSLNLLPVTAGHAVVHEAKETEKNLPEFIERPIWLVEKTSEEETYSNGLQILTSFSVENIPRGYVVFSRGVEALPGKESLSAKIRGILYHTSEGDMVPFKPEKNRLLKKYSSQLLTYTSRKMGYHYLIDRFGRVYRIVRDDDAAFHAGNAVWADGDSIFMNLNHAFIGICFEGKGFEEIREPGSEKPRIRATDDTVITEAQIQSGRELTDWLRYKYGIPQRNCVPHGIASVYPKARLIGYHLDLAYGFPFDRFGLENKYKGMIPSIMEFGFKGDRYFQEVLNDHVWPGINRSEKELETRARRAGLSPEAYRKTLHQRFDAYYDWQNHLQDNLTEAKPPEGELKGGTDELHL